MKKILTDIKTLGALLMAGAAFTACSDDNIVEEQPATPAQQTYTMTVEAAKGGDAATTRALALDGKTLNATWQTTDKVAVYNYTKQAALEGHLSPQSDGASATLTGSLTGSVKEGDVVYLRWPSVNADYTGQNGTLETIAQRYDYTTGVAKVTSVDGTAIVAEDSSPNGGPVTFTNSQAIVKFTLIDKANDAPIRATQLTIDAKVGGESRLIQRMSLPSTQTLGPITINRTEPDDNVIYAALPFSSQASFTFSLTATDGTHKYTYEKAGVTMLNGRYYEVKVKMTRDTYPITLSEVTSDNLGSVVTTDGTVYATVADASAASKTAAGMIAYVSGIGQGLVIALADETSAMNWNTAITTAAAHTPAVTGYSWKLPTQEEWNQMFSANGGSDESYTGLNTALDNAGGTELQDDIYWSSTPYDEDNAWRVHLFDGTHWSYLGKGVNIQVRACLAFGPARGHALASSAVGEIVGSDGLAYYTSDKNDLPSGVTAVAMVAYKNGNNGLAIALADETGTMDWSTAITTAAAHTPAITGGTWKLPSQDEWKQMFSANGGYESDHTDLNTAITNVGGTALEEHDNYWSSKEYDTEIAYYLRLDHRTNSFEAYWKNISCRVRACLAF